LLGITPKNPQRTIRKQSVPIAANATHAMGEVMDIK
jgi:hypothetical protein